MRPAGNPVCPTSRSPLNTSHHLTAVSTFISEVGHAPDPLRPLIPVHPFLHVLRHRLEVTQPRPLGRSRGQAHCASKGVDLNPGPEVHEGHAHGTFVVPLAGESLCLLLLPQLVQSLQEDGAEQT